MYGGGIEMPHQQLEIRLVFSKESAATALGRQRKHRLSSSQTVSELAGTTARFQQWHGAFRKKKGQHLCAR